MEYFPALTAPTAPESAQDFATRIQDEFDNALARDNEAAEIAQLDRQIIAGPGRFADSGAEVSVASGAVRISNGFYFAGAGVISSDAAYFEGLRLKQINTEIGYRQLSGPYAPPLNKSQTHGYMSWFGDAVWFDTAQDPAPDGRWYLGRFATDGTGATGITAGTTQTNESLAGLLARVVDLEAAVALFEDLSAGAIPKWGALQKSDSDATSIQQAIDAAVAGVSTGGGGAAGSGATNEPPDELIISQLRADARMQAAFDNSLSIVESLNSAIFWPGRGNWLALYDADFTTVTIDIVNNVIGD